MVDLCFSKGCDHKKGANKGCNGARTGQGSGPMIGPVQKKNLLTVHPGLCFGIIHT